MPIHVEENGWPTGPGRSEDHQVEALDAMVDLIAATHNIAEGAGALAWAALKKQRGSWSGLRAGCVLSGGNVSLALLNEALMRGGGKGHGKGVGY